MPTLLGVQVAQLVRDVGITGDALVLALAISRSESGWRTDAANVNPGTGDDSHGLWQINIRPEANPHWAPASQLYDPATNARAMFEISKGGTSWKPWSDFRNGKYRLHLDEARTAAQGLGGTDVSSAGEQAPGVPQPPQFTPAPTASLVAGLGVIGPNELAIEGELIDATATVITAELHRSIDTASSLTVRVLDEKRLLLTSDVTKQRSRTQVDGIYFELADVIKHGNVLDLTFIDAAAATYIHDEGKILTQVPGVATRGEFLRRLAAEHPEYEVDIETGATALEELRTEPDESLWQAMGRIARQVGWRRLATANRLLIGSDDWLASRTQPITIREHFDGIGSIDFDFVTGAQVDEATFTCTAALWSGPPTQAILVEDLGWADGEWIVASIMRTLGSTRATVTLTRPSQALPEPAPAPEGSVLEGVDLGAVLPGTGPQVDTSNTDWAGTQAICEALTTDFDDLGLTLTSSKRNRQNTASGNVSDHWVGNTVAYAEDWSNGGSPTPQMDAASERVMARLGIRHNGQSSLHHSDIHTINGVRVRVEVIYRDDGHYNHIHVGVERR